MRIDAMIGRTLFPSTLAGRRAKRAPRAPAGFTLIEMLVVLAIIVVITALVLSSQSSFNKTLILSNAAYDVALTLRSAESYGVSTRAAGSVVDAGYGIDVSKSAPGNLTLFADSYPLPSTSAACHPAIDASAPDAKPGDCAYEPSSDILIASYALGSGITVSDFCAKSASAWSCAASNGNALSTLDIVFVRPNPIPYLSVNGSYSSAFPVTDACITLTSPSGGARYVSISAAGEIRADAPSCP